MNGAVANIGWTYRPKVVRFTSLTSFAAAGFLLYWGWMHRGYGYFTPEDGLGYALGIVGGSLMLLLGLYPLRKHLRPMRAWGATRHWFRMHMVFGVAGPLAILFHCNFGTGAPNSNAALYAMLVVASSGLFGRYLYSRIHQGLYGRHIELDELRQAWLETQRRGLGVSLQAIDEGMQAFEAPLAAMHRTRVDGLRNLLIAAWRRRGILARARLELEADKKVPGPGREELLRGVQARLDAAMAVYRANAFERLFSLWHLLHLPLYLMLIVTGIVHVVAVNFWY